MTSKSKWNLVSRMGWGLLVLLVAGSACMQAFRIGKERGVEELLKEIQKPELQIMPLYDSPGPQLVLIRQILPDDEFKNRVMIDTSAFEGIDAKKISESGRGRFGYFENISLWRISNTTDHAVELAENEFTNLPQGFKLKSDYYAEPTIRLRPLN